MDSHIRQLEARSFNWVFSIPIDLFEGPNRATCHVDEACRPSSGSPPPWPPISCPNTVLRVREVVYGSSNESVHENLPQKRESRPEVLVHNCDCSACGADYIRPAQPAGIHRVGSSQGRGGNRCQEGSHGRERWLGHWTSWRVRLLRSVYPYCGLSWLTRALHLGIQALKALREAGVSSVLLNPNIATIMTSHKLADEVYYLPVACWPMKFSIRVLGSF